MIEVRPTDGRGENSGASGKRHGDKWEDKSSDGGEAAWGRYRTRGRCVCAGGGGLVFLHL